LSPALLAASRLVRALMARILVHRQLAVSGWGDAAGMTAMRRSV
jgi:hypothetical protein